MKKKKKIFRNLKTKHFLKNLKIFLAEIEKINNLQIIVRDELENILSSIPNIPYSDVPIGKDENSNIEISKSGINT